MGKLAPVLIGLVSADVKSAIKRTRMLAVLYAISAAFGMAALGAILVAAGIALTRVMRPEFAALVLAAILVCVCLVVLAAASIWSARQRRHAVSNNAARTMAAAAAVSFLPLLASNRAGMGLMALAAGYAIAKRKSSAN